MAWQLLIILLPYWEIKISARVSWNLFLPEVQRGRYHLALLRKEAYSFGDGIFLHILKVVKLRTNM
jgi:hypothetical protein